MPMLHGSLPHRMMNVKCLALLAAALLTTPATGYTLTVKTCDAENAGTKDIVRLSFCTDDAVCKAGSPKYTNDYNVFGELAEDGVWNALTVPLDHVPTTIAMSISGHDAWCVEQIVWEDGTNLLGQGARIYIDNGRDANGCELGVHVRTGLTYPCQSTWLFFNIQASDDYKYDVAVKACPNAKPARVSASFCSESTCDDAIGDIFKKVIATDTAKDRWTHSNVSVPFNPTALRLTGLGDIWCAEEFTINGYKLIDAESSPVLLLREGEERLFYNIQFHGVSAPLPVDPAPLPVDDPAPQPDGDPEDSPEGHMWHVGLDVIGGILLTAILAGTSRLYRRVYPHRGKHGNSDRKNPHGDTLLSSSLRHTFGERPGGPWWNNRSILQRSISVDETRSGERFYRASGRGRGEASQNLWNPA